jgi:hypothetical protein
LPIALFTKDETEGIIDKGRLPIAIFTRDETEGIMTRDACQYQYSQGMRAIKMKVLWQGTLANSIIHKG